MELNLFGFFPFLPLLPSPGALPSDVLIQESFFQWILLNRAGPNLTDNCELLLDYMENWGSANYCSIGKSTKAAAVLKKHHRLLHLKAVSSLNADRVVLLRQKVLSPVTAVGVRMNLSLRISKVFLCSSNQFKRSVVAL